LQHGDKIKLEMKIKRILATTVPLILALIFISQSSAQQNPPLPLRARVIVFVHGIHGDRNSFRASNGAYWPDLIRTDPHFSFSDVEVAEYPTPDSNGKSSSTQLAEILFNRLQKDHVWEHHEVVFLAHSLGGILVETMLLKHPTEAARVRFIVSYGTPHEGSMVARIASIYDKDPLLNDLSDAKDNAFLTQLENNWRGHGTVNSIHRFCAYETEDTMPDSGFGRALRTHARVVSYFSATYGCDVTTPPQEIHTDHVNLVRPADRNAPAYDFFLRVYRANPILDEQAVTRETITAPLTAACDQTNQNPDLQVPIALDPSVNERTISATALWTNAVDLRNVYPNPPTFTHVDPNGVAHIQYGFTGPSKKLFVCLANARASLKVQFTIIREVPIREPGN